MVTLWYRAPEICLGDVCYSCPVDMWALGCVLAEVLVGAPVFQANSVVALLFQVFSALGAPEPGEYLFELPLFKKATQPNFKAQFGGLPCDGVHSLCPELAAMLKGFFMLDPQRRLTAQQAAASHYFHGLQGESRLTPIASVVPAGRGPFSWVQGRADDKVLKWIQGDPHWRVLVAEVRKGERKTRGQCFGNAEKMFKHEEGSYPDHDPPGCTTCNTLDCSHPTPVLRLAAFVRAFRAANLQWLVGLTARVRSALSSFPSAVLSANGEHFLQTCFSKTAFCYCWIQVLRPGKRFDPEQLDGAASLLHAGFTIWGRRQVQYALGCDGVQPDATVSPSRAADVAWEAPVPQAPGDLYVGNLCAPWHRVVHGEPVEAEPLFPDASGNGFLITAMLRSDVFRANRARVRSHEAHSMILDDCGGIVAGIAVIIDYCNANNKLLLLLLLLRLRTCMLACCIRPSRGNPHRRVRCSEHGCGGVAGGRAHPFAYVRRVSCCTSCVESLRRRGRLRLGAGLRRCPGSTPVRRFPSSRSLAACDGVLAAPVEVCDGI